ncbi:hypothetical protein EYZ11_006579 [Aspergillus tanneri]|uniref:Uncharacterized protein n=1 Tax=Aspergillus tanneri TaxID=1220188 RepID=A0A4S3JFE7_9EURO|nr:hypothetical protein EYZ11_006579 [Aspergillus tanneri]
MPDRGNYYNCNPAHDSSLVVPAGLRERRSSWTIANV